MVGWIVVEILCVEPIYPQYSGVIETCFALRYWFFRCLAAKVLKHVYIYCYQSNVTKLYKVWLTSHVDYTFSVLTKNLFHVVPVPSHSSPTLIYSEKNTRFSHASGSIILVALKSLKSIKWHFTTNLDMNIINIVDIIIKYIDGARLQITWFLWWYTAQKWGTFVSLALSVWLGYPYYPCTTCRPIYQIYCWHIDQKRWQDRLSPNKFGATLCFISQLNQNNTKPTVYP